MRRRMMIGVLLIPIGVGVYVWIKQDASNRVKQQVLTIPGLMELTGAERSNARRLIDAAHAAAFDKALSPTRGVGGKFDAQVYIGELWRIVLHDAREEGLDALAEKIETQKNLITFHVAER